VTCLTSRSAVTADKIPGFSRQTGNFTDFPASPPFGREDGKANQAFASQFP
jgi:hypothetical protein